MFTSCWPQALALPILPTQESRAPGTLNNSLLQHLHTRSIPLPFPSPATLSLLPPVWGQEHWADVLSTSGHRHKDLPALHCTVQKRACYTTANPSQ